VKAIAVQESSFHRPIRIRDEEADERAATRSASARGWRNLFDRSSEAFTVKKA
jgi:hypothetical protein